MHKIDKVKVKIFADGADKKTMLEMYSCSYIKGLTTNPTLMKKAGIKDYRLFSQDILKKIKDKPLSLEVFSDDFNEIKKQALEIASWAENVYVKIPITNTKKIPCYETINELSAMGVKLNITAIMTLDQVDNVIKNLNPETPSYISIFAGRIADTGIDPIPLMIDALKIMSVNKASELIWASPRELLNIFQAADIGCHIITVTSDILNKLDLIGYSLENYSLDTVKMFYRDALLAGYRL